MSVLAQWQAEETFPPGPDAEDVVSPTWSTKVRWGQFPFFRGLGPIVIKKYQLAERQVQTLSLLMTTEPPRHCLLC